MNAVLIDDDQRDIELFHLRSGIDRNEVNLTVFSNIEAAESYLVNPENIIDLVFCDVRLDDGKEAEPTGFYLIRRIEDHLGRLPFGVIFLTRYEQIFAVTLLVEQLSPTTLCGFVVKWDLDQPRQMEFKEQIRRSIQTFQGKFTRRVIDIKTDGVEEVEPVYKYFFNDYLRQYENERINFDFLLPEGAIETRAVALKNIVALQDDNGVWLHYLQGRQLQRQQIDVPFKAMTAVFDVLDCTSEHDPRPALRSLPYSPFLSRGPVFLQVRPQWIVNLHHANWHWSPQYQGQYCNGAGIWLIAGPELTIRNACREAPWAGKWLRGVLQKWH